jgi:hypothetical protein
MQTGWIKNPLVVVGILLGLSLATLAAGQSKTPSVLDRVERVEDPQLGELIRIGIENRGDLGRDATLELIRKITLGYSQVRLLDRQIEEVSRKIDAASGPPEMRYDLLMAKTELESKLMAELTNLREVMGVIPEYPFDRKPVLGLSARMYLNSIGEDRVYVLDALDPRTTYWAMSRFKSLGLMSHAEAMNVIRAKVSEPNRLPVRIDILWKDKASEQLRDETISLCKEMGITMQADVRLELDNFIGPGVAPFYVRQGKIVAFYPAPVRRPNGDAGDLLTNGFVDPQQLEQHILWRITFQWNLPFTFRIEHDQASTELARHVADEIAAVSKRLDVTELVGVKSVLVEPVPEAAFLGRWRAPVQGEVAEVVIQPDGQAQVLAQVTMLGSSDRGPRTLSAKWYPTLREIIIDPGIVDAEYNRTVWRCQINGEGNLAVIRGDICPQGIFELDAATPIVLEKAQ